MNLPTPLTAARQRSSSVSGRSFRLTAHDRSLAREPKTECQNIGNTENIGNIGWQAQPSPPPIPKPKTPPHQDAQTDGELYAIIRDHPRSSAIIRDYARLCQAELAAVELDALVPLALELVQELHVAGALDRLALVVARELGNGNLHHVLQSKSVFLGQYLGQTFDQASVDGFELIPRLGCAIDFAAGSGLGCARRRSFACPGYPSCPG